MLPVTGRCPACHARIGPYPLAAELAAAVALALAAARASSGWELAALAWLTLIAVPLAFTDVAVHRLPDRLTAAAFTGTLALLTVAALTGHQPGRLARAAVGAAALACFYLALCLIRPGEMGLGDAKLAASIGLVLGWTSWQALLTGTFAGFALAAVYGGVRLACTGQRGQASCRSGPSSFLAPSRPSRSYATTQVRRPVEPARRCDGFTGHQASSRRWASGDEVPVADLGNCVIGGLALACAPVSVPTRGIDGRSLSPLGAGGSGAYAGRHSQGQERWEADVRERSRLSPGVRQ